MTEQSKNAGPSDDIGVVMDIFASQAGALDGIFSRALKEAVPGNFRYRDDMRTALKAQAQCRATLKILLELRAARQAEKISKFARTNYWNGKFPS
jgi:hypothetical protein